MRAKRYFDCVELWELRRNKILEEFPWQQQQDKLRIYHLYSPAERYVRPYVRVRENHTVVTWLALSLNLSIYRCCEWAGFNKDYFYLYLRLECAIYYQWILWCLRASIRWKHCILVHTDVVKLSPVTATKTDRAYHFGIGGYALILLETDTITTTGVS